jgi:hypothetical protein
MGDVNTQVSFQAIAQFSMSRPGMRANSKVFAVISTAPRRRAWAAMRTS